jgi:hypothetical protein
MTKAAELAKMGEVITNSQIGGRRNIIINGAMQVDQRNSGSSVTGLGTGSGSAEYMLDRFDIINTSAGRLTATQTADGPTGFANCLKLDVTTADTSISASEVMILEQRIEGQNVQQLQYGSSSAQPVTFSFYVKGNASATYTMEFRNEEDGRNNGQEFSVTTDWTRVVLTFAGDTAGSAVDDDNTHAFTWSIILHGGTTFSGGTFSSNTWHSTNNQRIGENQTSFLDSTDRTFFITGLQMEVGSQATPFEHRSFGEELRLCQRYCFAIDGAGLAGSDVIASGHCRANNAAYVLLHFPVPMRVKATSITVNTVGHFGMVTYGVINLACTTVALQTATPRVASINLVGSTTSLTVGFGCFMYHINDDGLIVFEGAEL